MKPIHKIVICGSGLAAQISVIAFSHLLPSNVEIVHVETEDHNQTDLFYGSVTSQSIYNFLLKIGISEPEILLNTQTSFSLGTHYMNWGPKNCNWVQSFHAPLPLFNSVGFHHYLKRNQNHASAALNIEDYIMSVQAAKKNVFAHPPSGKNIPLASVEYGYHFRPKEWCAFFASRKDPKRVESFKHEIETVTMTDGKICKLLLKNGPSIEADLFLDCTEQGILISKISNEDVKGKRRLGALASFEENKNPDRVCRTLKGDDSGWHSETPLRSDLYKLSLFAPEDKDNVQKAHEFSEISYIDTTLHQRLHPWTGNCVALGHSASILEPLTPAPIMMLEQDIERLLELLPVTETMAVEQREYNRRFKDDHHYASNFQRAFFETDTAPNNEYWSAAQMTPAHETLKTKIAQFKNRGILVEYDYEPFNAQDWVMMHLGMKRTPKRYDRLVNSIPEDQMDQKLQQMKKAIAVMAEKMPPHHIYMSGLLKYLKEKHV